MRRRTAKSDATGKKRHCEYKPRRFIEHVRTLPEIRSCANREELIRHCDEVREEILEFIGEIPDDYLDTPAFPDGWTAARNVRHVASSARLFSRWVGAPAWLLKLRGRVKGPVKPIEEQIATNRPANYDYGSYPNPKPVQAGLREKIVKEFNESVDKLKKSIMTRTDEELLTFKGAFGGMNLMVFTLFTLKHMAHHLDVVRQRLESR